MIIKLNNYLTAMKKEDELRQIEANKKWEKQKNSSLISEIYPNVLEIYLDLRLDYSNAFSAHKEHLTQNFIPSDKAYFEINCINRDCLFSDLDLDNEVRNTIDSKLESDKGTKICHGYNTYSCYRRRQGSCLTRLDFEIKIKYKNAL